MKELYLRSLDVLALRWLRAWGYRGSRPGLIAACLFGLLLATDMFAAARLAGAIQGFVQGSPVLRDALAIAAVVVLFFLAGPILLMTEAIRSRGSRLQGALSCLPLSSREIALIIWLPTFVIASALLALLVVFGAGAYIGLGMPAGKSLVRATTVILAGYSTTAIVIAAVRTLVSRTAWSSVQYPIVLLAWLGFMAAEVWQVRAATTAETLTPWAYGLLAPWFVFDIMRNDQPLTEILAVSLVTVGALAFLVWSTTTLAEVKYRSVAWNWSSRSHPRLLTMALTRLLRNRDIVANAIGAELLIIGALIAMHSVPAELQTPIFELLAAAVMLASSIPLLMVRGATKNPWPVPLTLGYGPMRWTFVEISAGVVICLVVALPGLAGFVALGVPPGQLALYTIPYGFAAFGLAMAIGWSVPASLENPIGQVINSFALVLIFSIGTGILGYEVKAGSQLWVALLLWLGVGGLIWAAVMERERWLRRIARVQYS